MKKILLLFILLLTAHFSQAQTEEGKFVIDAKSNLGFLNNPPPILEGGVGFNDEEDYNFTINLKGGYAVIDHLFLGMQIDYEFLSYKNSDPRFSSIFFGPFAKYYFNFQENPKVMPYLSASYSFGSTKASNLGPSMTQSSMSADANRFDLSAGLSIFLLPKSLTLDLNLSYIERDLLSTDNFSAISQNGKIKVYQFNLGFSLFL
ncbi:MAG: porin family protein [Flavobacteriaceae bacterium]|nr:porin family protein [Flavobacteriaceae bacterium]